MIFILTSNCLLCFQQSDNSNHLDNTNVFLENAYMQFIFHEHGCYGVYLL